MDEAAIRQWAWEGTRGMTMGTGETNGLLNFDEALQYFDRPAAWVMSGQLAPSTEK